MNPFMKKLLGAVLAVGLVALHLPAQTSLDLGHLPLWFEANHGQADAAAAFLARGPESEFLISATGAKFVLRKASGQTATARLQFVGARASASVSGRSELSGRVNYLVGNNPAQWQTRVPAYARVAAENIYPGVNVVYYGNERQLEYDLDLAAGVDPKTVVLHFEGADKISVNATGELVVNLNGEEIVQHRPVIYQELGTTRQEISGGYQVLDAHTATFALGDYDHNRALVIDPIISFSTYFGGSLGENGNAIAVDTNGYIYVAGYTFSTVFTNAPAGAYQPTWGGGKYTGDAFVAKFYPNGSNLVYFTYLGGSDADMATGLAVDDAGCAYVTGDTESTNFPVVNPLPGFGQITGPKMSEGFYMPDVFVAKLNADGTDLVYSTYLGGSSQEVGTSIAIDKNGNAYVAGYTSSTNFPVTTNAMQKKLQCTNSLIINCNGFISEIGASGTNLLYSSYLGGTNYDQATGIALDISNNIYVAGFTASTNFPLFNNLPGFNQLNGATNNTLYYDAFVCKFSPGFSNRIYSTYLGGTNDDVATGIAADTHGNAYVVGWTVSTNFPGIYPNYPGSATGIIKNYMTNDLRHAWATTNSFLVEIGPRGTNIVHAAVFGGLRRDIAGGVALDPAGDIFVIGTTCSTNFPVTKTNLIGSLSATNNSSKGGYCDVFVTAFKSDWSALLYSTYLGGSGNDSWHGNDFGNAIAVDADGNAYLTGQTSSTNFPTFNARQKVRGGTNDAFLTKISLAAPQLKMVSSGTNLSVLWPPIGQDSPAYFGLETTTNLSATNVWTVVTNAPTTNSDGYIYPLHPTNRAQFFRLYQR
jgi:hypothetical protein